MLRYVTPLVLFAALVAFLYLGLGHDPRTVPSPLIGKAAPKLDLPTLANRELRVNNEALRGKPVVLNVWASWCVACREEHAVLLRMARETSLTVIGMDYKDKPEDAQAWLDRFGNPYTEVLSDRDGRTGIDWGVYGVPETFVLDASGKVLHKHVGPLSWDDIQKTLLPLTATNSGVSP